MSNLTSGDEDYKVTFKSEPKETTIMMTTTAKALSLSPPEPFAYSEESKATASVRWPGWIRDFEVYLQASAIDHEPQMKAILLHVMGKEAREIYYASAKDGDDYKAVKKVLQQHFKPLKNIDYQKFVLNGMVRDESESMDDFASRLRAQAALCELVGGDAEAEIRARLIYGCRNTRLQEKILESDGMTLENILKTARCSEAARTQARGIASNKPESVAAVQNSARHTMSPSSNRFGRSDRSKALSSSDRKKSSVTTKKCFNCNGSWPHEGECPAKGKDCIECKRKGHYAVCCPSKKGSSKPAVRAVRKKSDSSVDSYVFATGYDHQGVECPTTMVRLGRADMIKMLIDSGAGEKVIDESTFMRLSSKPRVEKNGSNLFAFGSEKPLDMIGKARDVTFSANGRSCVADMSIVRGNQGCLLSFKTARKLGLFETYEFRGPDSREVASISKAQGRYASIIKRFPEVFNKKIGKLADFQAEIHIDGAVKPSVIPHRRQPYHLIKATDRALDELEENGVIEKLEKPSPWSSPIVVVPKPKKPGEVRITVDSRAANKAVKRIKYVSPTLKEIVYDLNGAVYYTHIDLNKAFHQIELKENCRDITAISTHRGQYRFKRLHMGVSSASEIFQDAIQQRVIYGLKGTKNLADDILVYGKTLDEHDRCLLALCERLKAMGLTADPESCDFGVEETSFFGLKLSKNGVSLGDDKVKALRQAEIPKSASEVRSFLGLAVYCASYIPKLATIADPLWKLTRDGVEFEWLDKLHGKAFREVKACLVTDALGFFDTKWHTSIAVDASPVGLGAVLTQSNPKDLREKRIIAYASKRLSEVEGRYSQFEKEALAVYWACSHFKLYLLGHFATVISDNKAVVQNYSNPNSKPPTRVERWVMRTTATFELKYEYREGSKNIADYLSRHPSEHITSTERKLESKTEAYVAFVAHHALPKAISRDVLVRETAKDERLSRLKCQITSGKANKEYQALLAPFAKFFDTITVTSDGLVLKEHQLIVPRALERECIRLAHEGHQGINKTKALLRSKVWFPGIDKMVEDEIERCAACQLSGHGDKPEPIASSSMPDEVWQEVAIDFFGPLPNKKQWMVLTCKMSRYPVVVEVKSTASEHTIPELDSIFTAFGIPSEIMSDNGPPFNGHKIAEFADYLGFRHRKITPLHPQANGQAEVFMKNLPRVVRNAQVLRVPLQQELNKFLRAYRDTPHSSTGVAPSALMFGRSKTSRLPRLIEQKVDFNDAVRKAINNDVGAKEKSKQYGDRRRKAKHHQFKVGEEVVVRQNKTQKFMTTFSPEPYVVTAVKGNMVSAKAKNSEQLLTRNRWHFRRITWKIEDTGDGQSASSFGELESLCGGSGEDDETNQEVNPHVENDQVPEAFGEFARESGQNDQHRGQQEEPVNNQAQEAQAGAPGDTAMRASTRERRQVQPYQAGAAGMG